MRKITQSNHSRRQGRHFDGYHLLIVSLLGFAVGVFGDNLVMSAIVTSYTNMLHTVEAALDDADKKYNALLVVLRNDCAERR